jgi:hypothetical protein
MSALPKPTGRNAARCFCCDGFGHGAPSARALWQVLARLDPPGRGAYCAHSSFVKLDDLLTRHLPPTEGPETERPESTLSP